MGYRIRNYTGVSRLNELIESQGFTVFDLKRSKIKARRGEQWK